MRVTVTEAAKTGFASRPTIYREIKAGRLAVHEDGKRKVIDVADLVRIFGEPGEAPKPSINQTKEAAITLTKLELEREQLQVENERLRRETEIARREASEERDIARKERDRLLGMLEASHKLLEDQSKVRQKSLIQRIFKAA